MAVIKDINQLDLSKRYTYADYLQWQFDEMVELIHGKIYKMSPAPNLEHQRVARRFLNFLENFLQGKKCEAFVAPTDVILPLPPQKVTKDKIDIVVQPDVFVVCDPSKLGIQSCVGAPDWIIEVLSKGTSSKDLNEKFELYQHAKVPEYWIAHPLEGTLMIFRLNENGKYASLRPQPYDSSHTVSPMLFPDLKIDLAKVFS
ncbi:MAG: Uma2 family endonuclease [Bacteroidota bacterium]